MINQKVRLIMTPKVTSRCLKCGKEFNAHQFHIKRGGGKFCSVECKNAKAPFEDHKGKVFGRLTVLNKEPHHYRHHVMWSCRCECGKEVSVRADALKSGHVRSCGCLMDGHPQSDRDTAVRKSLYLQQIKKRHSRKGWGAECITFQEYKELMKEPCSYCGAEFSNFHKDQLRTGKIISGLVIRYNGIDRRDNMKGYTKGNSVPCCKTCNKAKQSMTVKEFYDWISRVYHNRLAWEWIDDVPHDMLTLRAATVV